MKPDLSVIIVAGGKGLRMGKNLPKQFLLLGRVPVLMHTIKRFYDYDSKVKIILVLNSDYKDYWKNLCEQYSFSIPHQVVDGGKERFHSVRNGLEYAGTSYVAVHDAVRPFVTLDMINRGIETVKRYSTAVPFILPKDSYRMEKGDSNEAVDRSLLRIIQTPQLFDTQLLKRAYSLEYSPYFTDDASVVEHYGKEIKLYEGWEYNIKITTPFDLKLADLILAEYSEKFLF